MTAPQRAWPADWEQDPRIDDGHGHQWERAIVEPSPGTVEPVTRCAVRAAVNLDVPRADIATAAEVHRSTVNEWAKEEQ